jgi:hypothetical protein
MTTGGPNRDRAFSYTLDLLRCIQTKRCKVWSCGDGSGQAKCFKWWLFGICTCMGRWGDDR